MMVGSDAIFPLGTTCGNCGAKSRVFTVTAGEHSVGRRLRAADAELSSNAAHTVGQFFAPVIKLQAAESSVATAL